MQNHDATLYGTDMFGDAIRTERRGALAERFEFPPFSVLNAREGAWQERKRAWIALGIKSELGRGDVMPSGANSVYSGSSAWCGQRGAVRAGSEGVGLTFNGASGWQRTTARANAEPALPTDAELSGGLTYKGAAAAFDYYRVKSGSRAETQVSGTSIFDPVLCELAYRWFCPDGGQVIDPFAGGSVRGLLAALLGRKYWGCDLSAAQLAANETQRAVAPEGAIICWQHGDAMDAVDLAPAADFVFACPPYGDLERYSDDPRDLSTMDYHAFLAAYKRVILRCARRLKEDRFACFVVGDFRDKRTGNYRGFVADTVNAFREVGMALYNDAVLVTSVGSLPVRVSGTFEKHRKLGKTHQNVLVFAKGDPRKAFA